MKDFVDIGSSKGGSVRYCQNEYGLDGYGIDIDPKKVKIAQAAGLPVKLMNIQDVKDKAKWCTCFHVIEHLSGREEAREMIKKMLEIGENVYITLPCFDYDAFLFEYGFKFFFSDWVGHPFQPSSLQLFNILRDLKIVGAEWEYFGEVNSSDSKHILPLSAPKDCLEYNISMGEKELFVFDEPLYREVRIKILST